MKLEGVIFVTVVSIIIITIGAIYADLFIGLLFQYVLHSSTQNKIAFWLLAPIFGAVFVLLVISYLRAVCSSPGHPNRTIVDLILPRTDHLLRSR